MLDVINNDRGLDMGMGEYVFRSQLYFLHITSKVKAKGGGMGGRGREKNVRKLKVEDIIKRRALQGGSQK
jgi:hypothetical protein